MRPARPTPQTDAPMAGTIGTISAVRRRTNNDARIDPFGNSVKPPSTRFWPASSDTSETMPFSTAARRMPKPTVGRRSIWSRASCGCCHRRAARERSPYSQLQPQPPRRPAARTNAVLAAASVFLDPGSLRQTATPNLCSGRLGSRPTTQSRHHRSIDTGSVQMPFVANFLSPDCHVSAPSILLFRLMVIQSRSALLRVPTHTARTLPYKE